MPHSNAPQDEERPKASAGARLEGRDAVVQCRSLGKIAVAMIAGSVVLAGCNPTIEAFRSMRGIDKNDPGESAPFAHNMASADTAPYPNLADVPPPPTRATTAAEREKLRQSLVADRAATAAAMSQPPASPTPTATKAAAAALAAKAPAASQPPPPLPPVTAPPMPAASIVASAPPTPTASPAPAKASAAAPAAAPSASPKLAANTHQSGWRKAGEPPEPTPQDSTLQMPDVRSVPEPEAVRPAPPAPALAAAPRPAVMPEPTAALAAATPEPAPPVPVIAPITAPPPPATAKSEPKRPPASTVVARLELPAAGAPIGRDQAQIDWVASLYGGQSATVRVVGYAAAPAAGGDPLQGYRAALDRAQAVAKALATAGIPAAKIQTEAMPVAGPGGTGRIEIQFVQ